MSRAVVSRALSACVDRDGAYRRTAPPETVLGELAELPQALVERERWSRLALGIAAVPVPLGLVPVGYLVAGGMPPRAVLLLALPVALAVLYARARWKDRRSLEVPRGARAIEVLLRGLSWSRGSDVAVIASSVFARPERVLWKVEGTLASGARLVASLSPDARWPPEVRETVELRLDERRPWAHGRLEAALERVGVRATEQRISATSAGWSRVLAREDACDPDDVLARVHALLDAAIDAPSAPTAGYRDAPSSRDDAPAELGPIPVAIVRGGAWAARVWAAVLGAYAVAITFASTVAVATGPMPRTLGGAAVAGAGTLASVLLASWLAWRLLRTAARRTDA